VTVGPKIKYAGALEADRNIRPLIPEDRVAEFDALINDAYTRKDNVQFSCFVVVFEDWTMRVINACNYYTLCQMIENQGTSTVTEEQNADSGESNTDAALA